MKGVLYERYFTEITPKDDVNLNPNNVTLCPGIALVCTCCQFESTLQSISSNANV